MRWTGAVAFALLIGIAMPAVAGPVTDAAAAYGRRDYATVVSKIKETQTADWFALQVFGIELGENLYGEIARDHLEKIRPDPVQAIPPATPFGRANERRKTLHIEADTSCRIAMSFVRNDESAIRLWRMPAGKPVVLIPNVAQLRDAAVSPKYLAIDQPGSVRVYDAETRAFVRAIEKANEKASMGLFFSADGEQLFLVPQLAGGAFRSSGGRLFDIRSGTEILAADAQPPASDFARAGCPVMTRQTFLP